VESRRRLMIDQSHSTTFRRRCSDRQRVVMRSCRDGGVAHAMVVRSSRRAVLVSLGTLVSLTTESEMQPNAR
jgi:hypothetical protein